MNINQEILQSIKSNLYDLMNCNITYSGIDESKGSGNINISIIGQKTIKAKFIIMNAYVRPTFERLYGMYLMDTNTVFLGETFTNDIKRELKDNGISYIEMNGNSFINKAPVFIYIAGNKKIKKENKKPNRAFSKTGLKIILYYLTHPEHLNYPIRSLAAELAIGYTNFHYVNEGLKQLKYLMNKDANTLILHNKKDLLNRWIHNFEEKLKPTLYIGRFRFLKDADYKEWDKIKFNGAETQWGGEPAAALLTGNLQPQVFTVYTSEAKSVLATRYRMIPDNNGNIFIYKRFYEHFNTQYPHYTYPVLIYSDLVISQESRNMKIAKDIYEQYIQY